MNDMNEMVISGQVIEPPRMASTQSGKMVCKMRIKSTQERNGRENTVFIDVDVWETAGASYANTIPQGSSVVVTGRFAVNTWQDQNGNKRSTPVVVANAILPLAMMQMATQPQYAAPQYAPQPQSQYCQPQYYQQGVQMQNGGQYAPPQPPPMTYKQYQQQAAPYVNGNPAPAQQPPVAQTQQPAQNPEPANKESAAEKNDDVPF